MKARRSMEEVTNLQLKETVDNLISHYDLPGFGTDSNFPALQTVKNNNKIKESNIMKKFVFFIL